MDLLNRFWKRYVARDPDPTSYSVYASFPVRRPDEPALGPLRDGIDDLEYAVEGRLDVAVTRKRMVVRTDTVPREQFDRTAFERFVASVEDLYGTGYDVVHYTKSRWRDCGPVRSHVIVPVKPLFPEPLESRLAKRPVSSD